MQRALGWLLDDPCQFMFKIVLLSMSKFFKCPFTLIGWLLGDLVHFVPCSFMSKIAVLLNPRANHTTNMSADFFGQRRRALRQQAPPRSGFLLLFNKDFILNIFSIWRNCKLEGEGPNHTLFGSSPCKLSNNTYLKRSDLNYYLIFSF